MKLGRRLGLPFPTFLGVLGSGIRFKKKKKKKKKKEKCRSLVCQHNHVVSAGHHSKVRQQKYHQLLYDLSSKSAV